MHPVAWTLTSLDDTTEAKIRALINKAVVDIGSGGSSTIL
jgi:hypothetical protein